MMSDDLSTLYSLGKMEVFLPTFRSQKVRISELMVNGPYDEIHLTPKSSSTGPEGTIFYCDDDNGVYVGTE